MPKRKKVNLYGYAMTEKEAQKLTTILTEDILERYNNTAYFDSDIIMAFAQDNKLKIAIV